MFGPVSGLTSCQMAQYHEDILQTLRVRGVLVDSGGDELGGFPTDAKEVVQLVRLL